MKARCSLLALVAGLMAALPAVAGAATITVTTTADGGPGSLRAAIATANDSAPPNTIELTAGDTYTLTQVPSDLTVAAPDDLTIEAPGGSATIDAAGNGRAFVVASGATLTLDELTVQHANNTPPRPLASPRRASAATPTCDSSISTSQTDGGAILDDGTLNLAGDTFLDNQAAGSGGAIADEADSNHPLTITGSTFSGNITCNAGLSLDDGGAIYENSGSPVTITGSTFSDNSADVPRQGSGGALSEEGGATVAITDSSFTGNSAGAGGAINTAGAPTPGTVTLTRDLLSANAAEPPAPGSPAAAYGGAIFNGSDVDKIVNTTITGNSATDGGGVGATVQGFGMSTTISFSTIDANTATGNPGAAGADAGNIEAGLDGGAPPLSVDDSIIAGGVSDDQGPSNATAAPANCFGFAPGSPTHSAGHNVIYASTPGYSGSDCAAIAGSDIISDPMLDPLAANGGPTETEAVQTGSPAIDAADPGTVPAGGATVCSSETGGVDQRGVTRPQFPNCTIGAFEYQNADLAVAGSAGQPTITVGQQTTITDTISNLTGTGGYSTAPNVQFTDPGTGGYTITSASSSQGTCTHTATTVSCSLGAMPLGSRATISITLTGTSPGTVTLTSNVASGSSLVPDPHAANNSGSVTLTINAPATGATGATGTTGTTGEPGPPPPKSVPSADLAVTEHVSHRRVTVGHTTTFSLKVTDHGPDADSRIVLKDRLPRGLRWVSTKTSQATCRGHRMITCRIAALGSHRSVTVAVRVRATRRGRFRNAARVSGAVADPNLANNRASARLSAQLPPCRQNLVFTTGFMPGADVAEARVLLDGRLVRVLHGHDLRRVRIAPLPRTGVHSVTVEFVIGPLQTVTATRMYDGCSSGPTTYAYPPQTNPGAS